LFEFLAGVEWAVTKTTIAGLSAVVMTMINSLAIEHPEFSRIIRVPAPWQSDALPLLRKS